MGVVGGPLPSQHVGSRDKEFCEQAGRPDDLTWQALVSARDSASVSKFRFMTTNMHLHMWEHTYTYPYMVSNEGHLEKTPEK